MRTRITLTAMTLVALATPAGATRFHTYTAQYKKIPYPADPVAATYCGGAGSEWLAGVDFQPDGTLVAAGTSVGGPLTVGHAIEAEVLGRDVPEPAFDPAAILRVQDRRARKAVWPNWKHANRTVFVVRLSPDLKNVLFAARFPWLSGSATDLACDDEGNVYVAGLAGRELGRAGPVRDVSAEDPAAGGSTAFVAKLTADLSRVLWIRTFTDAGKGPRVRINKKGEITVEGGWLYVFSKEGDLTHVTKLHKVNKWARGVNPVDHTFALGGEFMTGTGREPWRRPHLSIGLPGPKVYQMYNWPGIYVGINSLRLVSDSVVRKIYFSDDGMLYIVGWSDGGNTVFDYQPCNIRERVPYPGLGFSAWGAGVLSLGHLVKIDPVTAEVKGKTLWCGFLKGKESPNSVVVTHINVGTDGSVILAGASAFGLIQTGNSFHKGDPGGPYITIMTHDFGSLRFSSTMPACGQTDVRDRDAWGTASAIVKGRHLAAYVCGAIKEQQTYLTGPHPAPTLDPFQSEFGGGLLDGWIGVFDLGPVKEGM